MRRFLLPGAALGLLAFTTPAGAQFLFPDSFFAQTKPAQPSYQPTITYGDAEKPAPTPPAYVVTAGIINAAYPQPSAFADYGYYGSPYLPWEIAGWRIGPRDINTYSDWATPPPALDPMTLYRTNSMVPAGMGYTVALPVMPAAAPAAPVITTGFVYANYQQTLTYGDFGYYGPSNLVWQIPGWRIGPRDINTYSDWATPPPQSPDPLALYRASFLAPVNPGYFYATVPVAPVTSPIAPVTHVP